MSDPTVRGTAPHILVATSRGIRLVGGGPDDPDDSGGEPDAGVRSRESADPVVFAERHVRALTVFAERTYAIVGRHEVWSAATASLAADPADVSAWSERCRLDEQLWCVHHDGSALWIGTEGAELYRLADDAEEPERVIAFAEHPDRPSWYTPWGGPPAVRSIDSTDDGTLFVNVHVGGIHRSSDGGASWEPTIDLGVDVHEVRVARGHGLVLASTGKGFARSADRGESWEMTTSGIDFPYMRALAFAGDEVLASASNGPHGDRGAVYRRTLGSDDRFARCAEGLPWFAGNVDTFCLHATAGGAAVVGGPAESGGAVYRSHDAGARWHEGASGLPEINAVALVIA